MVQSIYCQKVIEKNSTHLVFKGLREQFKSRDLDILHLQETAIANLHSNLGLSLGLQN